VLGICRGHQLLNVAHGGTLWQDVTEQAAAPAHRDGDHAVATAGDTRARRLLGREAVVPTGHHQSVRRLGRGLRALAMSPDGVVEMIEQPARRFAVGVQWHPETAVGSEPTRRIGEAFAEALQAVA
jgi:gamma-glutamyl-gamma-aminobutyrate hydrolase PuuD